VLDVVVYAVQDTSVVLFGCEVLFGRENGKKKKNRSESSQMWFVLGEYFFAIDVYVQVRRVF